MQFNIQNLYNLIAKEKVYQFYFLTNLQFQHCCFKSNSILSNRSLINCYPFESISIRANLFQLTSILFYQFYSSFPISFRINFYFKLTHLFISIHTGISYLQYI